MCPLPPGTEILKSTQRATSGAHCRDAINACRLCGGQSPCGAQFFVCDKPKPLYRAAVRGLIAWGARSIGGQSMGPSPWTHSQIASCKHCNQYCSHQVLSPLWIGPPRVGLSVCALNSILNLDSNDFQKNHYKKNMGISGRIISHIPNMGFLF